MLEEEKNGLRSFAINFRCNLAFNSNSEMKLFLFLINSAEIERNRQKVMEINYYLDNQQIAFEQFNTGIRDQLTIVKHKEEETSQHFDENEEEILETADIAIDNK